MANPLVNSKLDFYPIDAHGLNIHKFSQSRKWHEELPSDMHVQMVSVNGKHFYIYEPTQLMNGSLVIPIFFYLANGELHSKCIRPRFSGEAIQDNLKLLIPHLLTYDSHFQVYCFLCQYHTFNIETFPVMRKDSRASSISRQSSLLLTNLCLHWVLPYRARSRDRTGRLPDGPRFQLDLSRNQGKKSLESSLTIVHAGTNSAKFRQR